MYEQFQEHIENDFPFLQDKKLVLAISGGVDSVVLAHLCDRMGLNFSLAHCNFQLRGKESDQDESFVRDLAIDLKVPVWVKKFNTRELVGEGSSVQLIARKLRYEWFEELVEQEGFDFVLTAHHLNDDVETFFINLIRGTGIEGLAGIPVQNAEIVRPLLDFSRQEIRKFALSNKIRWREDSSNAQDDYLRNRIRHRIIPLLEDENPDFLTSFELTRNHLKDTTALLKDYAHDLHQKVSVKKNGYLYFDIRKLSSFSNPRAVLYVLLKPYGFTEWDNVYSLLHAQSGKMICSGTHRLLKDRDYLILDRLGEKEEYPAMLLHKGEDVLVFPQGRLICESVIKVTNKAKNIAYLASERLVFPLKLRRWEAGDSFQPLGMKGQKKLSDFLRDEKVSLFEKEKIWVLVSEDTIVWVVGHRIHEAYKVQPDSLNVLKIKYIG